MLKEWEEYISQIKRTRKPYVEFLPSGDRSKVSGCGYVCCIA